ncbi:cyclin-like protein [Scheffersomyces stipitis CBS 6054]|uniref:Cyclin-like protein n=1 Tax=Scheffersomyces stipitis (strain ATCC 58785 / CBS 6054 / NBRC 10063 / NRRL Y-11545) TaxID=322104 RepID=A3LXX6_PICST|nr:cyclin-like protein [Scheffersomyces stipitis CBS 6054]ABN67878.2 cyclin-like protein [Scheffersomyces stipitis CBS 6054]
MYQVHSQQQQPLNYYHHNLGTAGHRATSSYSFLPSYATPNSYCQPPVGQAACHNHSRSMYSTYQAPYLQQPIMVGGSSMPHIVNPGPVSYGIPTPSASVHAPAPVAGAVEEQPQVNGGINPVLEYDLNNMSTFLSWCAFGMLKQQRNPTKEFEGLVVSVLFATRLPKSTIIIALEYMNQRFSSKKSLEHSNLNEHEIFIYLIVALILANKFNDDNTFTNKSWCGATGLQLSLLNKYEKTWLEECKWSLNVVNFESNILTLEECWKTWLEKYGKPEALHAGAVPVSEPSPVVASPSSTYYPTSSPMLSHQYSHNSLSSIPSSPVYQNESKYYYPSSPVVTSPVKYGHESAMMWSGSQQHPSSTNIWSYAQPNVYAPSNINNDPAIQYVGNAVPHHHPLAFQAPNSGVFLSHHPNSFVGYANPYFLASC